MMPRISGFPYWMQPRGLGIHDPELNAHVSLSRPAQLSSLCGRLDGPQDSLESGPFRIWRQAYSLHQLPGTILQYEGGPVRSLWTCGYVMWDWAGLTRDELETRCEQAKSTWHKSLRPLDGCPPEARKKSEQRRKDIRMAGGRGYWPLHGLDFSRIHGLSVEEQDRLVDSWCDEDGQITT